MTVFDTAEYSRFRFPQLRYILGFGHFGLIGLFQGVGVGSRYFSILSASYLVGYLVRFVGWINWNYCVHRIGLAELGNCMILVKENMMDVDLLILFMDIWFLRSRNIVIYLMKSKYFFWRNEDALFVSKIYLLHSCPESSEFMAHVPTNCPFR